MGPEFFEMLEIFIVGLAQACPHICIVQFVVLAAGAESRKGSGPEKQDDYFIQCYFFSIRSAIRHRVAIAKKSWFFIIPAYDTLRYTWSIGKSLR